MKRSFAFVVLFLIAGFSFGFQQQGRKAVSLDNEDLSPYLPPPGAKLFEISPGEYSPSDSGYAVRLPQTPMVLSRKVPTPIGEMVLQYMTLKTEDMEYNVGYIDYPPMIDVSNPEGLYGGFREGVLRASQALLVTDKSIKLKEQTGREIVLSKDGVRQATHVFLIDHRLYAVTVDYSEKQDKSKEVNQFFNSFRFTSR